MSEMLAIAKEWGIFAAIAVVFIWWTYQRELRLSSRVTELETFVHTTLMQVIEKSTTAITKCTEAMNDTASALFQLVEATRRLESTTSNLQELVKSGSCPLLDDTRRAAGEDYRNRERTEK